MDAIALLKKDHATLRSLLDELEQTTTRNPYRRADLLEEITTELMSHSAIETEIFYPAFKAVARRSADDTMYFEALEEHRLAGELLLRDLHETDPASEMFSGCARVLRELINHHASEEEKQIFPRARELMTKDELASLGKRMEMRKDELLTALVD